jgi:SAM-dependent methyltransferase
MSQVGFAFMRGLASTDEWRDIARVPNLYFHILSLPGREAGLSAEEFYATGAADWEEFAAQWQHYAPLGGRVVEIGCGAGRLTRMLATSFASVVALDVSADMIDRAREVCPESVTFHQVDSATIPEPDASADAVFSVLVLQHLDDFDAVRSYLSEAHRVLKPGGTVMLDITIAKAHRPSVFDRLRGEIEIWRSRRDLRKGNVHSKVRWREYPWEQVLAGLQGVGFDKVEFHMFPIKSSETHYYFWMGTR